MFLTILFRNSLMVDKREVLLLAKEESVLLNSLCENVPAEEHLRQERAQEITAFAKRIGATEAIINADASEFLVHLKAALEAEGVRTSIYIV